MSETPEDRPRPAPRPRPGTSRPVARPRVAGSRRDREADAATCPGPVARVAAEPAGAETEGAPAPAATAQQRAVTAPQPRPGAGEPGEDGPGSPGRSGATPAARRAEPAASAVPATRRFGGGLPWLALCLAVLCALAAVAGGLLLTRRIHPPTVAASVFTAARSGVQDLYAYDYKDSKGSVARKLAVLTGQLHDQYQKDLSQGGIIDTYQQVSATTSFDVVDVGLVQVNDSQDAATMVVFGQYRVKSVNSGNQPAPQGSECTVTGDGAQSCTQTVQLHEVRVDGAWKIDDLTLKTTS